MPDEHRFELGAVNHVLIVHGVGGALSGSVSHLSIQKGPVSACAEQIMTFGGKRALTSKICFNVRLRSEFVIEPAGCMNKQATVSLSTRRKVCTG